MIKVFTYLQLMRSNFKDEDYFLINTSQYKLFLYINRLQSNKTVYIF